MSSVIVLAEAKSSPPISGARAKDLYRVHHHHHHHHHHTKHHAGRYHKSAPGVPKGGFASNAYAALPERHLMVVLCALCTLINYADRVNMSVAIISLSEQYGYDTRAQSIILSAFFLGYIPMNIGGALLCRRHGGKAVLLYGAIAWSLCTILTPPAATLGLPALVACRVAMGLSEGVAFPAIFHFTSLWVPPPERARSIAIFLTGVHVGTTLALVISPLLIAAHGWPSVFYSFGFAGFFWVALWHVLARDRDAVGNPGGGPDWKPVRNWDDDDDVLMNDENSSSNNDSTVNTNTKKDNSTTNNNSSNNNTNKGNSVNSSSNANGDDDDAPTAITTATKKSASMAAITATAATKSAAGSGTGGGASGGGGGGGIPGATTVVEWDTTTESVERQDDDDVVAGATGASTSSGALSSTTAPSSAAAGGGVMATTGASTALNMGAHDADGEAATSATTTTTTTTTTTGTAGGGGATSGLGERVVRVLMATGFTRAEAGMLRVMVTDRRMVAVSASQCMYGLVHFTILSWLPTYFKEVYGGSTERLAITCVPYAVMIVSVNVGGWAADALLRSGVPARRVRKQVTAVACIGSAAMLVVFATCETVGGAVAAISAAMAFKSLNSGGFESAFFDIAAPGETGLFKGVANTLSSISGFVAVPLSAVMLDLFGGSWRKTFASLAVWYVGMAVTFCTLYTGERMSAAEEAAR